MNVAIEGSRTQDTATQTCGLKGPRSFKEGSESYGSSRQPRSRASGGPHRLQRWFRILRKLRPASKPGLGGPYRASPKRTSMDPKFGQKSEFVSSTDLIPCNVQSSLAAVQAPYIACLYAWVFEPGLGGPYRASPKRTSMDPKFGQKSEFVSSTDLIPCNVQSSLAAVQAPEHRPDNFYFYPLFTALF